MVGRMLGPPIVQFARGNAPLVSVDQSSAVGITLQLLLVPKDVACLLTVDRTSLRCAAAGRLAACREKRRHWWQPIRELRDQTTSDPSRAR
jgi:hypothetical protein